MAIFLLLRDDLGKKAASSAGNIVAVIVFFVEGRAHSSVNGSLDLLVAGVQAHSSAAGLLDVIVSRKGRSARFDTKE